jgi:hypothetical protein
VSPSPCVSLCLRWGFLATHASVSVGLKTAEWRLDAAVSSPYKLTAEHVKPALPALLVAQWFVQRIAARTEAGGALPAAGLLALPVATLDTLCAELTAILEQCAVLKEPVVLGRPSLDGSDSREPAPPADDAAAAAPAASSPPVDAELTAEYIKSSLLCWMVRKVVAALLGPADVPMEVDDDWVEVNRTEAILAAAEAVVAGGGSASDDKHALATKAAAPGALLELVRASFPVLVSLEEPVETRMKPDGSGNPARPRVGALCVVPSGR